MSAIDKLITATMQHDPLTGFWQEKLAREAAAQLARYEAIEQAAIILLKSRDCWVNSEPEIAEEISAQFDIGLDDAKFVAAALAELDKAKG